MLWTSIWKPSGGRKTRSGCGAGDSSMASPGNVVCGRNGRDGTRLGSDLRPPTRLTQEPDAGYHAVMLRRLTVRNFKSLRDVTVELPRLSVLFGPNAAGKSNLLEATQALSWIGNARTLNDALQAPYPVRGFAFEAFSLSASGLPAQLAHDSGSFVLEADLETQGGQYRYRVAPRIVYRTGELTVADEYLARLRPSGTNWGAPAIERVNSVLRIRRKGKPSHPREERIGLHHSVLSDRSLSGNGYAALDHVRDELSNWRTYYFEPRTLMRQEQPPAALTDIGIHGEHLASFLHYLRGVEPQRFESVSRRLRTIIPGVESVGVALDENRGTLSLAVRQAGAVHSSRVVSEGTLRVLALCAVAANPWYGSLVTLEEPENGVHPRRIERIASLLMTLAEERQIVVSSHSPVLVDAILRARRESENPDRIGLFNVRCGDEGTVVEPFDLPGALFQKPEILKALTDRGEDGLFEALVLRGLVDE